MKKIIIYAAIGIIGLLYSACDKNSTSSHSHHVDAVGMRIISSGQTLTSYVRDDTSAFKAINLTAGQQTAHMDIEFYDDEDEDWMMPEGNDYSLEIAIADTGIAGYWQHEGEEGGFEFHLTGKKQGETTAIFRILHESHKDFESRPVTLKVH